MTIDRQDVSTQNSSITLGIKTDIMTSRIKYTHTFTTAKEQTYVGRKIKNYCLGGGKPGMRQPFKVGGRPNMEQRLNRGGRPNMGHLQKNKTAENIKKRTNTTAANEEKY